MTQALIFREGKPCKHSTFPATSTSPFVTIASDLHAPETSKDQPAQARPFTEAFPALAEAMRKNAQGRPARLDQDGQGRKVGRGGRLAGAEGWQEMEV
ncbi:hypothetical protein E2975_00155 (plasmid) [Paracoccus yeei]